MAPLLDELRNCRCRWRCRRSRPRSTASRRLGAAQRGRPDHRGLGRVPGHRLRAGHPGRRAGPGRPLHRPRLPVAARVADRATPQRPTPTRREPEDEAAPARRRGRRGDRRPAAALRRAGGAPAAPRQGAALVGVVGPVRRAAARRRRLRHLPPGHGADRQPVPAAARPATPSGSSVDEDRERYMWTRMREHLAATGADPADCLYVCGAFHAASRVEEFGVRRHATRFAITPRTATTLAVRADPVQPLRDRGAVRARRRLGVDRRGDLGQGVSADRRSTRSGSTGQAGAKKPPKKARASRARSRGPGRRRRPTSSPASCAARPTWTRLDEAELLGWCVDIVRLARRNGYLATTADAIAVFETSILLAGMRNRARPDAVRLPGRGRHLHREGRRAGPARRAPAVRDPAGRRPDRPGRLRRAAAAGPRRATTGSPRSA